MLDEDLARMYKVETRRLNEQVKRNINTFSKRFHVCSYSKEYENLMSQMRHQVKQSTKTANCVYRTGSSDVVQHFK